MKKTIAVVATGKEDATFNWYCTNWITDDFEHCFVLDLGYIRFEVGVRGSGTYTVHVNSSRPR